MWRLVFWWIKSQSFKTELTTSTIRVNIFEPVCQTVCTVSFPTETMMLKQQKQLIADCIIRNIPHPLLLQDYMGVKKNIPFSGTIIMINNIYDAYYCMVCNLVFPGKNICYGVYGKVFRVAIWNGGNRMYRRMVATEQWEVNLISRFRRSVNESFALLVFTQRRCAVINRRFGVTYRSHLRVSSIPR